jgi:hypothetical protein
MVVHQVLLVILLMGQVKQQPSLKRGLGSLQGFSPGVVVEAEGVVAAGLVDVVVLVLCFSQ